MKRYRSNKYLAWVRKQPCVMCGRPAGEAHHIKGVGHLSGVGLKADDSMVIPVCTDHHRMFHDKGDRELIDKQWEFAARTLMQAFREGVISC